MAKKIDLKKGKLRDIGSMVDITKVAILSITFISLVIIYIVLLCGRIETNKYATTTTRFYNENSATDFQIGQMTKVKRAD